MHIEDHNCAFMDDSRFAWVFLEKTLKGFEEVPKAWTNSFQGPKQHMLGSLKTDYCSEQLYINTF